VAKRGVDAVLGVTARSGPDTFVVAVVSVVRAAAVTTVAALD
jgi:hypothetical protein